MGFEASERYCDASLILESIVSRGKVLTPPAAFEGLSTPLALSIIDCTPAETKKKKKMQRKMGVAIKGAKESCAPMKATGLYLGARFLLRS